MCVSSFSYYLPFEVCEFPIVRHVLQYNGTLSESCVVRDWHRIMDGCWKQVVIYLNRLFFIKATKFEAVECSKIGYSWAYQLTLPAVYQLTLHGRGDKNMDVLAKLMDYMPSKCNTLKANITAYI